MAKNHSCPAGQQRFLAGISAQLGFTHFLCELPWFKACNEWPPNCS